MIIKSWHKYNESSEELTEEMIMNIIYFVNCSIMDDPEVLSISKSIDSINLNGLQLRSLDTTFSTREELKITQGYVNQIYQASLKDVKLKSTLLSIFKRVKDSMGKIMFTDYEDLFLEFLDNRFYLDFLYEPGDFMKVEIRKDTDITEHIEYIQKAMMVINRLIKIYNIPDDGAYISSSSFECESGRFGHKESHIEIKINIGYDQLYYD